MIAIFRHIVYVFSFLWKKSAKNLIKSNRNHQKNAKKDRFFSTISRVSHFWFEQQINSEIVNRLIINYKCIKVKCTKFLILSIKAFYMTFSWRNFSQGSIYVRSIFQTFLAAALPKAKPERLSSQNFETVPLITLTARKAWKLTFSHLQQFSLRACYFFLPSVRYKFLFWISKSKEKSSAKLRGPLPHLEGMLDRWFCEVNTSKSRRKNQGKKIYQESYC